MLRRVLNILHEEGLGALLRRAGARVGRRAVEWSRERSARRRGSFARAPGARCPQRRLALSRPVSEAECIPGGLAALFLGHRFDLLGSGWVQVRHGMACRGLAGYRYAAGEPVSSDSEGDWLRARINASNLEHARSIWRRVDPGYEPIDWQLDFKSGHRWSEGCWAKRLEYGVQPGVDVKVPWELARMQHLPQLALRALALGKGSVEAARLAGEVRNQMLDFMAANPPGFGVNWLCPMDVAIRGVNWAMAWDLLAAGGFAWDVADNALLADSLHDHGRFVAANLEWSPDRGNHYLSHVCGLAFIAAYLPESDETNGWLAFALGELNGEILRQFHADGGHFEGSIAYHRLCTEMALYAVALALGLPGSRLEALRKLDPRWTRLLPRSVEAKVTDVAGARFPLDPAALRRLRVQVDFFAAVLKPDGTFPQIGDNDSGRFLKISPVHVRMRVEEAKRRYVNLEGYGELPDSADCFIENGLDGRHLLAVASALGWGTQDASLPPDGGGSGLEREVAGALAGGRTLPHFPGAAEPAEPVHSDPESERAFLMLWETLSKASGAALRRFSFSPPVDFTAQPLAPRIFGRFGLYVFLHPRFYLSIRCLTGPSGGAVRVGAHFHADQQSLELEIDGVSWIRDPGTYVYTPLPHERNRYRAASAHGAPVTDATSPAGDVFGTLTVPPATVDYCGPLGFAASLHGGGEATRFLVRIQPSGLGILRYGASHRLEQAQPLPYSPGYGIQEAAGA